MALLMALGLTALVLAAALVSLRLVSAESELQAQERRSREAFFAAEAGLAEGREVVSALLNASATPNNYSGVMGTLGEAYAPGSGAAGVVEEAHFPANGQGWYQVLPFTPYTLQAGAGLALDDAVTEADRELRAPDGEAFGDYPEQASVHYRVFLHDDGDDALPRSDSNGLVWLVSVGEVRGAQEQVLARSVVRTLVAPGQAPPGALGYGGQKLGGSDKTSGGGVDMGTPMLGGSTVL